MTFQEWFEAHKRRNPNAKINATTRDLYRAWLRNNPRDPGEGGPGAGRVPGYTGESPQPAPPPAAAAPAPAPPPGPPPTIAPRVDAAQELGLQNLARDRNLLPSQFNSRRNRVATGLQSGLLDSGYFDTVDMTSEQGPSTAKYMDFATVDADGQPGGQQVRRFQEVSRPADAPNYEGNVTYRFRYGPDGRLYRQAYMNTANAFGSRGIRSSSLITDTNKSNMQSFDTSRDQSIRNYNETVAQIGRDQTTEDTRLTDQITTGGVGYANWTGNQDVALPSTTNTPSSPSAQYADPVVKPTTTSTPPAGNLGTWTVQAAGANAIPRLTRQVRARNPDVSFRIVRRGDRYVAVRT
jgi:hypothetical protein